MTISRKEQRAARTRIERLWAAHKYDIMARGYRYYKEVALMFRHATTMEELLDIEIRISGLRHLPYTTKGLRTSLEHMWGYVKKHATVAERTTYEQLTAALWDAMHAQEKADGAWISEQQPLPVEARSVLHHLSQLANKYEIMYLQTTFQQSFE
ncbi:hypothetical protein [Paenibacillus sp. 481]|uniref:hypothetical protein n=1 Tax=Paenibacillus sp. 481 TaxID=2835869 RepID=UPI001E4E6DC0|nr:hypothetical protein [Paenibacillus sp. 481]UHA75572.1 hypothetical protein KIK04_11615 [Paenibacillus sp. 481]